MMHTKYSRGSLVFPVLLAALLIAASACGDDGGEDQPDATSTPDAAPDAAEDLGPGPFAMDMYVRGSFSTPMWDPIEKLRYLGSDRYLVSIDLAVGMAEFKIAPDPWDDPLTFSADAAGPTTIELDTPVPLFVAPGLGNNTILDVAEAGTFDFAIELPGGQTGAPVLTVSMQ